MTKGFGRVLVLTRGWIFCVVLATSCATRNVDPPSARPHTGYLDFYADDRSALSWQIQRMKGDSPKTIFERFEPVSDEVVRLAFTPGRYDLRVTFLNRTILKPGDVQVLVEEGQVTPVRVTLEQAGKTIVATRRVEVGGTFYGRSGRSTRIRAGEAAIFRVEVQAQTPLPYQPRAEMPYAKAGPGTSQ